VVAAAAGQWFLCWKNAPVHLPPFCASGRWSTTYRCSLTIAIHQIYHTQTMSVTNGERSPGRHYPDLGHLDKHLGTGHQDS
jgi:hypothetical protein